MTSNSIKLVLFGKSTVGKTSIANRLVYGNHLNPTEATIGVTFMKMYYNDISYDIWDTAGQERYLALTPMYFRNARIMLFVFDIDYISTIHAIDTYIPMLEDLEQDYQIFIIGNKIDLMVKKDIREIEDIVKEKFDKSTVRNRVRDLILISAKDGKGFDTLKDKIDRCAFEIKKYINYRTIDLSLDQEDDRQCTCL